MRAGGQGDKQGGGGTATLDRQADRRALADEIKRRPGLLADVIGRYVKLTRRGAEYVGLSPFSNERTPSFTVVPAKGFYHCFSSGQNGDVIAFVQAMEGIGFVEAVDRLAAELGLAVPGSGAPGGAQKLAPSQAALDRREARREDQRQREAGDKRARARAVWRNGRLAGGTLVESYLRSRGLGRLLDLEGEALLGAQGCLRCHPALPYHHDGAVLFTGPAMLAAIQGPDLPDRQGQGLLGGGFRALHATWLAPDGTGKRLIADPRSGAPLAAKKIFGSYLGGAIRLSGREVFTGRILAIAEGIESALAARLLQGMEGQSNWPWPVWAAGSLGNIAGGGLEEPRKRRHPEGPWPDGRRRFLPSILPDLARPGIALPASVEEVVILADNDSKDPHGFECQLARAAARWQAEGRAVRVARPPAGQDWNDVLMERLQKEKAA